MLTWKHNLPVTVDDVVKHSASPLLRISQLFQKHYETHGVFVVCRICLRMIPALFGIYRFQAFSLCLLPNEYERHLVFWHQIDVMWRPRSSQGAQADLWANFTHRLSWGSIDLTSAHVCACVGVCVCFSFLWFHQYWWIFLDGYLKKACWNYDQKYFSTKAWCLSEQSSLWNYTTHVIIQKNIVLSQSFLFVHTQACPILSTWKHLAFFACSH